MEERNILKASDFEANGITEHIKYLDWIRTQINEYLKFVVEYRKNSINPDIAAVLYRAALEYEKQHDIPLLWNFGNDPTINELATPPWGSK